MQILLAGGQCRLTRETESSARTPDKRLRLLSKRQIGHEQLLGRENVCWVYRRIMMRDGLGRFSSTRGKAPPVLRW